MTEVVGEGECERKADHYFQPQVQEGVFRYIYQKVQQKRAELESTLGVKNNWFMLVHFITSDLIFQPLC